jgi:hypothetical protein
MRRKVYASPAVTAVEIILIRLFWRNECSPKENVTCMTLLAAVFAHIAKIGKDRCEEGEKRNSF